ncbi:hypothetical protein JHK82_053095 [Glycine max]|nr:hypothetical protein JHK86_052941 [Glycine max]KAG4927314.1 hypothetical protein JHK85_053800 [Glycine max]KAG5082931.1 hypothetical protein JHK84_052969 [Glycine max]KAG5085698.1 hypothetical protein JHK82_053095 [Glycine max]
MSRWIDRTNGSKGSTGGTMSGAGDAMSSIGGKTERIDTAEKKKENQVEVEMKPCGRKQKVTPMWIMEEGSLIVMDF